MHTSEMKHYLFAYLGLVFLTMVTIAFSGSSHVLAFFIAFLKAVTISFIFMHLLSDKKYRLILFFSVGVGVFLILSFSSDFYLSFHQHSF